MKKRILAAVLWFVAAWCVGAVIAFVAGLSPVIAPLAGTVAAAIVAGDPRAVIWRKHNRPNPTRAMDRPVATA